MNRIESQYSAGERPSSGVRRRSAFSLIELLIVMVVIAILAALLLPAINSVRRTARLNQVKAEITRFDTAIARFNARYGIDPPSAIVLPNLNNGAAWDPISRRRIRSIWPQFNFGTVGGIPAAYFRGNDYVTLTGAECLVFFLGGLPQASTGGAAALGVTPVLTGFSKNPRTPFGVGGSNRDTFYEFDSGRLVDVDQDGWPEYVDSLSGQTTPFLYVSSYGGKGYPSQTPGGIDDFDVFNANDAADAGSDAAANLYNVSEGTLTDAGGSRKNLGGVYQQGTAGPWKKESYQIISPGEDKSYSTVPWSANSNYAGGLVYIDPDNIHSSEADNITNFNEGTTLGN